MTINIQNKPQGVLFDLDGTLLDTANDLGEALNFVLRKYNLPIVERETYRPVASDGALGLLNLGFKEQLIDFDYDVLRHEFLNYYQENIANHTCLYSGVKELLSQLNTENVPWGIVTNKPEGLTKQLLPYFPEFQKCVVMVGGDTLTTRKPDPEPLFYACEQMNVDPKQCLYVGDALRDIEAGNNAGMQTYIAKWGYIKSTDNIEQWHADFIIKTPQELFSIR
ncbi:MAG: HAD-IA family hydrolase [Thalassotalea sp.]|nr:HAD-IA family hydrolase [Thalassotalea sp.]